MYIETFFNIDSDGITREYLKFGNYPSDIVTDEKIIESLNNIEIGCCLGKSKYEYIEFQGDLYCRLNVDVSSLDCIPKRDKFKPHFECGKEIKNEKYYFKVEPIIWHVLRKDNNHLLLFSKKILGTLPMERIIHEITFYKEKLSQIESLKKNDYKMINSLKQIISNFRLTQFADFQKKYEDNFVSAAFSDKEISLIVNTIDENPLYRTQNKEIKKLIKKNSCDAIASDFARVTQCMFSVKEKNEGVAPYWYIEIDEDLKLPLLKIENPFFLYSPNADSHVGIRPVIEICVSAAAVVENQKKEEEIIEKIIQDTQSTLKQQEYLTTKVDSICFAQVKPEPAPVFSGFIPMTLVLTIVGIPIALVYGIIRGIIQASIIEKFVPKENAIEIINDKIIRLYINGEFNDVLISDIDHFSYTQKQFSSVNLVPSTYNVKTCSYGKVVIYTNDNNKYVIPNMLFSKGVCCFLSICTKECMWQELLNINNDQFLRIMQAIAYVDSNFFDVSVFQDTIRKIIKNVK